MKTKCLATGSCGFILSNVLRKASFQKENIDFIGVDKIGDPKRLHHIYANKNYSFYLNDCSNLEQMSLIFELEKPDIVLHAAESSDLLSSLAATQTLLQLSLKHKVKKFVYLSDMCVWDDTDYIPNLNRYIDETKTVSVPQTNQGIIKRMSENLINYYGVQGLEHSIIRFGETFGPRQAKTGLIPKIISSALLDQELMVPGWGKETYHLSSIDDIAQAILLILKIPNNQNGIYHVSNDFEATELELINLIEENLKIQINKNIIPEEPKLKNKIESSYERIKKLGWISEAKLKSSLEYTCKWYANNSWFLK